MAQSRGQDECTGDIVSRGIAICQRPRASLAFVLVSLELSPFDRELLAGAHDAGIRVSGGGNAKGGGEIEILAAVRVPDMHAFRAFPDDRPGAVGVDECDVARFVIAKLVEDVFGLVHRQIIRRAGPRAR